MSQSNNNPIIIAGNNIITTPYEKVLSIINDAKKFINMMSKNQSKLIRDLEWVIKVITSHSLYTYELKDNELIQKYSNENQDFKQFVEFVSEYNEEVIQMNKKTDLINSKSLKMNNELLIPSFKLKRKFHIKNNSNEGVVKKKFSGNNLPRQKLNLNYNNGNDSNKLSVNSLKAMLKYNNSNNNFATTSPNYYPMKNSPLKKSQFVNSPFNNLIKSTELTFKSPNRMLNIVKKYPLTKENHNSDKKQNQRPSSSEIKSQKNTLIYIESLLSNANYDFKQIFDKEFNIFELKKIVGHSNVLPIMGKYILEEFGLNNDKIIQTNKLESFLINISNQYYTTVQYHNSIHGADVTQTICLFFLNSNIEEVCQTKVLDLLSIIIAALGHDIGHPGLTNNFQINASTDMAITYNDISCLENFHSAKLFKTIKIDDNNIFEILNDTDYKLIRKRIISEILATDMANHGKVMTLIKAKIPNELFENKVNINENRKFELLSKNPKTQFEEQQSLLDYLIHAADLAHNTKLFKISITWVELLTNEFWLQGDKEKRMNLPVSFLCDRIGYDIPSSQVGFIKGFVIPTFDILITMFPTLSYTVENAKINLNKWQKLVEEHRLTGWTPRDKKDIEKDDNFDKVNNDISKKSFTANWGKPKLIIVKKPK